MHTKLFFTTLLLLSLLQLNVYATGVNGDLSIEILAPYNLVEDSNGGAQPEALHVGVRVCNNGSTTMNNVEINVGNYDDATYVAVPAPGDFPATTHPGLTGLLSLELQDCDNGTRTIPSLGPGECIVQYWFVRYPVTDVDDNPVHGHCADETDDLSLEMDAWVTVDGVTANDTWTFQTRCEISANANKIWPNGDNKVPQEYVDALAAEGYDLGWEAELDGDVGDIINYQGIWFDLGNVNQGFDNDGDFVPDYNVFIAPVGNPYTFDPCCFRLVRTYGLIIVKLNNGTEEVIPFEDQMYFTNINPDNRGVLGLVFYQWLAIGSSCTSNVSPYQSAASGSNNEKFNSDYGAFNGGTTIGDGGILFDKTGQSYLPSLPGQIDYSLDFTNDSDSDWGAIGWGMPTILKDAIPIGTTYVGGSAAANNSFAGLDHQIYYSTDDGATWDVTEPADPATVTTLAWWIIDPVPPSTTVSATFSVSVPITYSEGVSVDNTADVTLGENQPITQDSVVTFILGDNTIEGTVFEDDANGDSESADFANAAQGAGEAGIGSATVTLYYDNEGDGVGDVFFASTTTAADGTYSFDNLPDGNYVIVVSEDLSASTCDGTSCVGWASTSTNTMTVDLDSGFADLNPVTSSGNDLGFVPALLVDKTLVAVPPVYEGQTATFDLEVENVLPVPSAAGCYFGIETVRDEFTNQVFNANYGTVNWASDWQEINESNGPTTGSTYVHSSARRLVTLSGTGAQREVDLTCATSAQLTFIHRQFAGAGTVSVDISDDNGSSWTNIDTYEMPIDNTTGIMESYDILPYVSRTGNTIIRFLHGGDGSGQKSFDNIQIEFGGSTTFDANTTLDPIPLQDLYNPSELEYVSASVEPDNVDETNGIITWNNVGPLNAGEKTLISVTFNVLEPAGNVPGTTSNTASVTNAFFSDGTPANSGSSTVVVPVDVEPTGSISGYVWSDANGNGWQGSTGYDAGDFFIPNAEVILHMCTGTFSGNSCTEEALTTVYTDENGYYQFDGLLANTHYYVEVVTASLPGGVSETGNPDDDPINGSGDGGLCGTGGGNAGCDSDWDNGGNWFEIGVDVWNASMWDPSNINFGYTVNPVISGYVWEDVDGDGTQDPAETGMAGVSVELQHAGCTAGVNCPVAVTDANGNYEFDNLTAGTTYTIVVQEGTLAAGGTWTETSESDGTINNQITLTLTTGEVASGNNSGYHQTGTSSIGDVIYYDLNGNGIEDAGEEGLPNITVTLYEDINGNGSYDYGTDAFVATTQTDINGNYSFDNLPAGDYVVVVNESDPDLINNAFQTADPDEAGVVCSICDGDAAVSVDGIASVDTIDFGYQATGTGSIGDLVWNDANGDGALSVGEAGLEGIIVELYVDMNGDGIFVPMGTTTTDANGYYNFDNLPDGDYQVTLNPATIPVDNNGYDYQSTTYTTFDLTITNSVVDNSTAACTACPDSADFGLATFASIGNQIFWDANGNGTQDWSETGIPNVEVSLYEDTNGDGIGDILVGTQTTDANGNYMFTALPPADYIVVVDMADTDLNGAPLTSDPDSDGLTCDEVSDPDPLVNQGHPACDGEMAITANYGMTFGGADFGFLPMGVIGDMVWQDFNGNGIQDNGEPGLPGITVELQDGVCTPGVDCPTAETDIAGNYIFDNLMDGNYTIVVTDPTGTYSPTGDPDGTADNTTTVVISGGDVTEVGGTACTDCGLTADFGMVEIGTSSIAGNVCLETSGSVNGTCGDGTDSPLAGDPIYLYNDEGYLVGTTIVQPDGSYSFNNLPDDIYNIALSAASVPLSLAETTDPANVTDNGSSFSQTVDLTTGGNLTNVDFPFEITTDVDFGDLPSNYPTLLGDAPIGAYHVIPNIASPDLYLGAGVDSELDGISTMDATGDDTSNTNDEDGVDFGDILTWTVGVNGGSATPTITGSGWLVAYADWNKDGDFLDADELIISEDASLITGAVSFDIPAGTDLTGFIYTRFRLMPSRPVFDIFAYSGIAYNGEVEDYMLRFGTTLAENDINQTPANTPVSGNVLTNDTDADGDVQSVQSVTGLDATGNPIIIPTDGTPTSVYDENGILAGDISINTDGTYTFTPAADYTGEVPLNYTMEDATGLTDDATLVIEVIPVNEETSNQPPVANDDTNSTEVGVSVSANVITPNDSDPDGDALTLTSALADTDGDGVVDNNLPVGVATTIYGVDEDGVPAEAGSITLNADGSYTFVPNGTFTGEVPVEYTISDGNGGTDSAVLTITVEANFGNNTYANDDANLGPQDEIQTGNILNNDNDPEGDNQEVGLIDTDGDGIPDTDPVAGIPYTIFQNGVPIGTFAIDIDEFSGDYIWTPAAGYVGTAVIAYTATDGTATDMATLYLTTLPTNSTDATDDFVVTPFETPVAGNVLTNDTDEEGDNQTVSLVANVPATDGVLVLNPDGTYIFVPSSGFVGETSFTYEVCDDGIPQACDTATVYIEVLPSTSSGTTTVIANPDFYTTEEGTTLNGTVSGNDLNPEGTAFDVTAILADTDGDGISDNPVAVATVTTVYGTDETGATVVAGTLVVNADGSYQYVPAPGFTGELETNYTITDEEGDTDSSLLSITVVGGATDNHIFATDDAQIAYLDTPATGSVVTNDHDPEGHSFTVTALLFDTDGDGLADDPVAVSTTTTIYGYDTGGGLVEAGTLVINTDGSYSYTPATGFTGNASAVYTICDDQAPAACDNATLDLTVIGEYRDYGDSPSEYPEAYHSALSDSDGDRILDGVSDVWLGTHTDFEVTMEYSPDATADDYDDAITCGNAIGQFPMSATPNANYDVDIALGSANTGTVYYGMWIDWDGDFIYEDFYSGSTDVTGAATAVVTITTPSDVAPAVNIRLRADDDPLLETDFEGGKTNGEVEDYQTVVALPVEMLYLNAAADGCAVNLGWSTATELDNRGFIVEHSTDGVNFEMAGFVDGQGTTTSVTDYTFIHDRPAGGLNYYRLAQIDWDGTVTTTDVVYAEVDCSNSGSARNATLYPNPSMDGLVRVNIHSPMDQRYEVMVYTTGGQLVKELSFDATTGFNRFDIDLFDLKAATYNILIKGGDRIPHNILFVKTLD